MIAMIWGSTFVVNKQALRFASPLMFNAVRMCVASAALLLYYRRSMAALTRPAFLAGSLVGIFMFLGYELQITGLAFTTPSRSAFLTGVSTVLVPIVLLVFWKTLIPAWRAVGVALALVGLFLLTVPGGSGGLADFAHVNRGDLLTIGCAFAFAFQIVLLGRAAQRFPFEQIAVLQVAVAAALMLIAAPLEPSAHLHPSRLLVAAVLITGIVCTAVAFTVQAWAQQFTPATHAALIFTLEPVFAWLTSLIFLHESLGARAGIGAAFILTGVLVSELLGGPAASGSPAEAETGRSPVAG